MLICGAPNHYKLRFYWPQIQKEGIFSELSSSKLWLITLKYYISVGRSQRSKRRKIRYRQGLQSDRQKREASRPVSPRNRSQLTSAVIRAPVRSHTPPDLRQVLEQKAAAKWAVSLHRILRATDRTQDSIANQSPSIVSFGIARQVQTNIVPGTKKHQELLQGYSTADTDHIPVTDVSRAIATGKLDDCTVVVPENIIQITDTLRVPPTKLMWIFAKI